MTQSPQPSQPAGWYPDPHGQPILRWWDGNQWTDSVQQGAGGQQPPDSPTPQEKRPIWKRWWAWLILAILIIGIIAACFERPDAGQTTSTGATTSASETSDQSSTPVAQPSETATDPAPTETSESPESTTQTRDNSSAQAATLGAGTFSVGTDVQPGRYVIAAEGGGSGNFVVYRNQLLVVNEILGSSFGVPNVTVDLESGDSIEIRGIPSVSFTPAETALSTTLTTGTWIVGIDISAGRYVASPAEGQSGNFVVYTAGLPLVNEILGGDYGVPSVTVTLVDGQKISISGITQVSFAASAQ